MTLMLARYYAAVDAGDFDGALTYVDPAIEFALLLPSSAVRGSNREELFAYLDGRGDVVRRHAICRESVAEDLEFVYGAVIEDEARVTGYFLATARLSKDRLIDGYQVVFDPKLGLVNPSVAPENGDPS